MKKKWIAGLVLAMVLGLSTLPVSAAEVALAYPAREAAVYDEETAVEDFIAAQEARKTYLAELLDSELISRQDYDLYAAEIDANIEYVEENGLAAPYGGQYGGYGYGGCCGGAGGYGMRGYGMGARGGCGMGW